MGRGEKNIVKYIYIFGFLIVSVLVQHIIHELMHVFVARMQGLKVEKIQWFTYHGGTKIYVKNEEKIINSEMLITKQWILMNIAGISTTTVLGYIFVVVFYLLPMNLFKLFVWELAIVFLLTDSSYLLLCAFNSVGDLYLVNRYLANKKYITKIIAVFIFGINCGLTYLLVKYQG